MLDRCISHTQAADRRTVPTMARQTSARGDFVYISYNALTAFASSSSSSAVDALVLNQTYSPHAIISEAHNLLPGPRRLLCRRVRCSVDTFWPGLST